MAEHPYESPEQGYRKTCLVNRRRRIKPRVSLDIEPHTKEQWAEWCIEQGGR